jgi:hypothetical protein
MKELEMSEMQELIQAVVDASTADVEENYPDPEQRDEFGPKVRDPASEDDIAKLEKLWGRKLPPSYRRFLETTNGLENVQGTHTLLGVGEYSIKNAYVEELLEVWGDVQGLERSSVIPVVIPGPDGEGIRNLWAFVVSDDTEMKLVDLDNGVVEDEYPNFVELLKELGEQ